VSLLDNLPHICTIRLKSHAQGSMGQSKVTARNVRLNMACWEQPAGDSEFGSYQKEGVRITHKVFFLENPYVKRRYQIVITHRQGVAVANPKVLDVVSYPMPDATAGLGVCYRVLCEEVTSEDD